LTPDNMDTGGLKGGVQGKGVEEKKMRNPEKAERDLGHFVGAKRTRQPIKEGSWITKLKDDRGGDVRRNTKKGRRTTTCRPYTGNEVLKN